MEYVLLVTLGPLVAAMLLAIGIRFLAMRSTPRPGLRVALLTVTAGAIPAVVVSAPRLSYWIPSLRGSVALSFQAIAPLVLGIVAVLLLMIPPPAHRTGATAELTRRSVRAFVSARWVWMLVASTAAIAAVSIAAGTVSGPDSEGRYTEYSFAVGTGFRVGTTIYGWHYSIPALGVLAALLVVTVIAWLNVPRPGWQDDARQDAAVRRLRAGNIGRVATGALLVHLAVVLRSLAGTASLRGETPTTELGTISAGPPFAALGPVLECIGWIALAAGLTMWILTALTAIPSRHPATQTP